MFLAQAWAHRMQFLFTSLQYGLLDEPELRRASLELYASPTEFQELMSFPLEGIHVDVARINSMETWQGYCLGYSLM